MVKRGLSCSSFFRFLFFSVFKKCSFFYSLHSYMYGLGVLIFYHVCGCGCVVVIGWLRMIDCVGVWFGVKVMFGEGNGISGGQHIRGVWLDGGTYTMYIFVNKDMFGRGLLDEFCDVGEKG